MKRIIVLSNTVGRKFEKSVKTTAVRYFNDFEVISLLTSHECDYIKLIQKISQSSEHIFVDLEKKQPLNLENQFNQEVNLYLKNILNENNNLFNKIFLPYINLSPSSENIISDEKILILEETKFFIKNRNITKAYDSIIKIENYKVFFKVSLNEMNNYNIFITEISKLNNV